MLNFILNKIMGSVSERQIKRLLPIVDKINSLEATVKALSDGQLRAKTDEFRKKFFELYYERFPKDEEPSYLNEGEFNELEKEKKRYENEILDEMLPQVFAVVREAARRTIDMRHFDVQLVGGMILHEGKIAEMATGEGKTLVATLAAYLNAITGRGVHIVTVNDYLARRDRDWMGPIYEFLGLTVGTIQHDMDQKSRRLAYACDITYGTNNEFGFDYLRENMVVTKEDLVQRELNFGIVDEVDSILIDEARTPLIISGPAEESTELYYKIDKIIPRLACGKRDETTKQETGDYVVDEKAHTAYLTEEGEIKAAKLLGLDNLHDIDSMEYKHHINQALRAHTLFKRDVDYVIKDGQIIIVDEFTGRLMPGRRWSEGLHQAIEAKENVKIERENQTLATVTFQNLFRMYRKLAGMTGTAQTEAAEFSHIYKLEVVTIPTNQPLIRTNYADAIYKTEKEKFDAVIEEISQLYSQGRPILVGTISIDKSERLSSLLRKKNIPHNVLNAKYHEMEAHIVAQAGRFGAITIATNMAGRGTDILLGGNYQILAQDMIKKMNISSEDPNYNAEYKKLIDKFKKEVEEEHKRVVELGGLHVVGTERHEARRIDNQLRGRSGRQGDPGSSKFFISLGDDLMRIFGSDRIAGIMNKLGMEEGQVIQHPFVTKAIETAQKRVEAHNFEIRKQLLEYDNVMNTQREVIYQQRRTVLEEDNLKDIIIDMISDVLDSGVNAYLNKELDPGEWDYNGLSGWFSAKFAIQDIGFKLEDKTADEIKEKLFTLTKDVYEKREKEITPELVRGLEKMIALQVIDSRWKDHLYAMDNLREGIGLRAYGQMDPLVEYKNEGYNLFSQMISHIKEEIAEFIFKIQPVRHERLRSVFETVPQEFLHPEIQGMQDVSSRMASNEPKEGYEEMPPQEELHTPYVREAPKVGRNDPCPCGSGKKYKKCCGK